MCKAANSSGHSFSVAFSLFWSTPIQWFLVLLVWKHHMYFGSFCCDWEATSLSDIRCSGYYCGWWVILACIHGCTAVGCASFATSIVCTLSEVCEAANPSGHSFSVAFSLFWSTPFSDFLFFWCGTLRVFWVILLWLRGNKPLWYQMFWISLWIVSDSGLHSWYYWSMGGDYHCCKWSVCREGLWDSKWAVKYICCIWQLSSPCMPGIV